MLTQDWNPIFSRIEFLIDNDEKAIVLVQFEGNGVKKVRIDQVSSSGGLTLFNEISTCNGTMNLNIPIKVNLLPGFAYVVTPFSGTSCTAQIDSVFPPPDKTVLTSPTATIAATVCMYHCHLADRDNVHITIVIEDASGGGPKTTPGPVGKPSGTAALSDVGNIIVPPPPPTV